MPIPDFGGLGPDPSFNDLVTKLNQLVQKFRTLLLNLDTLNIVELDAKVIKAGTITADKIDVDKLSAISADLGEITAGIIRGIQIFGSYIATRDGAYPRAEMNDSDDLFAVYQTASIFAKMAQSIVGSPGFVFEDGITRGTLFTQSIFGPTTVLSSTNDIDLSPGTSKRVNVPSWSQVFSGADNQTLAQALNDLTSAINTLNTNMATKGNSTGSAGGGNGGIPIGTQLMVSGGGTVTWAGISSHSHTQT